MTWTITNLYAKIGRCGPLYEGHWRRMKRVCDRVQLIAPPSDPSRFTQSLRGFCNACNKNNWAEQLGGWAENGAPAPGWQNMQPRA